VCIEPWYFELAGYQIDHPERIWVGDTLIAAIGVMGMKMALAAVIESIFVVMGEPGVKRRQCPLAMDKWMSLVVAEQQLALGLVFNTRILSVAMTKKYLAETLSILETVWLFDGKQQFKAMEALKIAGKLQRLGEVALWEKYMLSQFYSSITFALAQNKIFLQ
jgi:hypothetical protein